MSRQIKSLLNSFRVALRGIVCCVRNERNMRIHLAIVLGVLLLSLFYDFAAVEWGLLLLLFGVVLSAEMMNTAVERVVDLLSPSYNNLAKLAKDLAAGAVLICAASAVMVGLALFIRPAGIENMLAFIQAHGVVFFTGVAAYAAFAFFFIFLPARK